MCSAPMGHSNREMRAYLEGSGLSVQALPVAVQSAGDQPMGRAHLCSSNEVGVQAAAHGAAAQPARLVAAGLAAALRDGLTAGH